jgi:serine-type D-Ala-D-Ala carboxypeptidase (penicillin-binding protein 5/6)
MATPMMPNSVARVLAALTAGLLIHVVAAAPAWAQKKEEPFSTTAPHAILVEAESGTILFEKAADQLNPPASLSKLMTLEVVYHALSEGKIKPEDEFIVSENAWRKGGAPSRGSAMYAAIHSRVAVRDLIRGAVIQSGNDACITLAEGIAGTENNFAELMNKRARELGLTKSFFSNSTGLHEPNMKVTARELAVLARHIIQTYPDYYRDFGESEFTWNKIRQYNRNPLLRMNLGADGLKTGFTKEAGYGLVGSAVQSGMRLIVVVMGLKSEKERSDEARKLLDWGFRGFESRPLFAEGQTIGEAKVYGGSQGRVPLVGPGMVRLMVPRGVNDKIIARVVYTGPVLAPIAKGQAIGKLKVWRGDNVALEVPLQAAEDVGIGNVPQRAFDAVTELVIGLFRAGAQRL